MGHGDVSPPRWVRQRFSRNVPSNPNGEAFVIYGANLCAVVRTLAFGMLVDRSGDAFPKLKNLGVRV